MISNISTNSFAHSVVIPIDPKLIFNASPNMEMESSSNSSISLNNEAPESPHNKTTNHKQTNRDNNGNDVNSNGNCFVNKETLSNPNRQQDEPSLFNIQALNTRQNTNNNVLNFPDYSQSPFNPLLSMTTQTNNTQNHEQSENEELSLASNQFKLFVQETLKNVSNTYNNPIDSLKAHLIIPPNSAQENTRWGLKISGINFDLVNAAKREIMRSPMVLDSMLYNKDNSDNEKEEVDMENNLRTSKTIESLLEDGDDDIKSPILQAQTIRNQNEVASSQIPVYTSNFVVMACLSGLVLGTRYNVIKSALANYNCTITWDSSSAFVPNDSTLNLRVTGPDSKSVDSVMEILKNRNNRVNDLSLAITTLNIDSGKIDWIYSSGAIKKIEEILWKYGATLTLLNDSIYQVTCLSNALLNSCLKRVHDILSLHQSVQFTFKYRNDFRDFSIKCSEIFESLSQMTNCTVDEKCTNGCVLVEIGGSSKDLARAMLRLETFRSQIFESGSFDLKIIERRLRLHVPAEIKEFICGKKDGKLTRIMKETGVNINLNMIGGDSMYVDINAEDPIGVNFCTNSLLHALRLIEGELPAELTFHIPELHHKRMIGHGGKVIQRIMKKWGVYVKFMNNNESYNCHQTSDPLCDKGSSRLLDNVVVKTPSKNGSALKAIMEEIFEECSVSETTGTFDPESFKSLKKIQSNSKSRVSLSLPHQHRPILPNLLRLLESSTEGVEVSLLVTFESEKTIDKIILEGEKEGICEMVSIISNQIKKEISFNGDEGEIIIKSPNICKNSYSSISLFQSSSWSPSLSEESFKFFPSALFVVQSHQSLSASGSPILSSQSSFDRFESFSSPVNSIPMNSLSSSLNSSPPLPVGHQKTKLFSANDSSVNLALAETRRRSADIF